MFVIRPNAVQIIIRDIPCTILVLADDIDAPKSFEPPLMGFGIFFGVILFEIHMNGRELAVPYFGMGDDVQVGLFRFRVIGVNRYGLADFKRAKQVIFFDLGVERLSSQSL